MTDRRRPYDVAPDDPPTEDDLREAAAFAARIETPSAEATDLEALVHGIAQLDANNANPLVPSDREIETAAARSVNRAIDHHFQTAIGAKPEGGRIFTLRRAAAASSAVLALAAGVVFVMGSPLARKSAPAPLTLIESRSTQPLFTQPFSQEPASARIDRIATARIGDLRENHFRLVMAGATRRSR